MKHVNYEHTAAIPVKRRRLSKTNCVIEALSRTSLDKFNETGLRAEVGLPIPVGVVVGDWETAMVVARVWANVSFR